QHDGDQLDKLIDFIANAPADESLIKMDCNDCCENITRLAEQVANGADLNEIWPEMQKFMRYWGDCREEFEALVAVIRQEKALEYFDFAALE
ncbi:MAG: hypothetical protein OXG49_12890, partial [Chloroflexi bacterium]|nr:hypothetical protein [Chloroflexota bacterium]